MPEARADLIAAAGSYTQPGSGPAALEKLRRINAALAGLADFPEGRPRTHDRRNRMMTVAAHWVIYRFDAEENVFRVLRVFGPGQEHS